MSYFDLTLNKFSEEDPIIYLRVSGLRKILREIVSEYSTGLHTPAILVRSSTFCKMFEMSRSTLNSLEKSDIVVPRVIGGVKLYDWREFKTLLDKDFKVYQRRHHRGMR